MTTQAVTGSGVPGLGEVPWGSHFCHFFDSHEDLADTLVPYFKVALEQNEACLWVTSDPLSGVDARAALASVVRDLDALEARGQIEIVDHDEWYTRDGTPDARATLDGWLHRERRALERGFDGIRISGNTYWVERKDWPSFIDYESMVTDLFNGKRMIALCSYCAGRCSAHDVLDVVRTHQFAVARRAGEFEIIESAALRLAREDLLRVQRAREELNQLDRKKNEFIAMLSHELRNPMAPLQNAIEVMRLRGADASFGKELNVAERQIGRLRSLLEDLLDVAGVVREELVLDKRIVELRSILSHAVDTTRPLLEARHHTLAFEVPDGLSLHADAGRLTQAFARLLSNAAKYMPERGHIEVMTQADAKTVEIRVRDNGPGIPPHLASQLFELFVQGTRSAARSEGGIGVGLPIAKRIIELHGGSIAVNSAAAEGAEFVVRLPRAHEHEASVPPRDLVLVVDDNRDGALALAEGLELLGHQVVVAHDASMALALVAKKAPTSAIIDLSLPGMDGCALATRLRSQLGAEVKLIALTGHAQQSDRERTRAAGFDLHLLKPANLHAIDRLIGSSPQPS